MTKRTVNAIILSRKNIGEADRLLSALSEEEGKLKIIVRGARKIKSKLACHVEPFSIGKFYLIRGKTFDVLAGAESSFSGEALTKDIELYKDASYICELTDLLVEEEKIEVIYRLLAEVLTVLPRVSGARRELLLHYFEYNLLSSLGYEPNFYECYRCHGKLAEESYYYGDFEGVTCSKCRGGKKRIELNTLKILRQIDRGKAEDILKIKASKKINESLKEIINPYLYDILPRRLKSYEL
ncbi:MAG: DNA repair protein RecO [Patescibacteria group bacterium]|nr:DNA repair protein RecO [Patescibacteria group bacterium]